MHHTDPEDVFLSQRKCLITRPVLRRQSVTSICLSPGSSDDGRETPGTTVFVVWSAQSDFPPRYNQRGEVKERGNLIPSSYTEAWIEVTEKASVNSLGTRQNPG